jgi:hypothetical protein
MNSYPRSMESTPNPIPPVELQGTEHGDLPVNDPPPSDQPEENSPVQDPQDPEGEHKKKKMKPDVGKEPFLP